ncbi:MAG: hypothetical protein ACYDD2_00570 [Candidatus Acidiferrales bacterium]
MRVYANVLVCAAVSAAFALHLPADSPGNPQGLTVATNLLSQEYCRSDNETFVVSLKLRLRILNGTHRKLIVDKNIGKAWYDVTVADSSEALTAGRYEYNPNTDWFPSSDQLSPPKSKSPGRRFSILAPGQFFEVESIVGVVVSYNNKHKIQGTILPGNHVLQLEMASWLYTAGPGTFKKHWQRFGDLVDGIITTEPLPFRVPSKPHVETCE